VCDVNKWAPFLNLQLVLALLLLFSHPPRYLSLKLDYLPFPGLARCQAANQICVHTQNEGHNQKFAAGNVSSGDIADQHGEHATPQRSNLVAILILVSHALGQGTQSENRKGKRCS